MNLIALKLLFIGLMIAVAIGLLFAFMRLWSSWIKVGKSPKTSAKTHKQEMLELLEAHSAARDDQQEKPKVGYAILAGSEDMAGIASEEFEGTILGRKLGIFVFCTTAAPLILAGVLLLIDILWLLIHLINKYAFQFNEMPWPSGLGLLSLVVVLIPVSIFAGLAMLPFGYRSQFKIGTCETVLAILTLAIGTTGAIGLLFSTPFESIGRTVVSFYVLYVTCFALFGAMYFLCSLLGLCTTGDKQIRKTSVPFGNWPSMDDSSES